MERSPGRRPRLAGPDRELAVIRAATVPPPARAVRELLALQASDWAFLATRRLAGEYPRERMRGHADALARALAEDGEAMEPELRHLAPDLMAGAWL